MSGEAGLMLLRPWWLLGYLPLVVAIVWWLRDRTLRTAWASHVDADLLPYVVESGASDRRGDVWWLFVGWALALLVLAGPVREEQDIPVYEAQSAQVILFDLSRSMLTDDLAPNRLMRARFKLADLLARSDATRTGLVAFAERPYTISPLTDDAATLEAFLPSLDPSIMPVQGSRVDLAIARGVELLEQGDARVGHLILMTDATIEARDIEAARAARLAGHRVSVLSVATSSGAPLRGPDGQFLRQANGGVVVPQLDAAGHRELAEAGGGVAMTLRSDSRDLDAIEAQATRAVAATDEAALESGVSADRAVSQQRYWIERGPWLLPLLAAMSLLFFRRGAGT